MFTKGMKLTLLDCSYAYTPRKAVYKSRHPKDGTFIPATLCNPRDQPIYSPNNYMIAAPNPDSVSETRYIDPMRWGFAKLYIIGLITSGTELTSRELPRVAGNQEYRVTCTHL